jgi:hypothetical protein
MPELGGLVLGALVEARGVDYVERILQGEPCGASIEHRQLTHLFRKDIALSLLQMFLNILVDFLQNPLGALGVEHLIILLEIGEGPAPRQAEHRLLAAEGMGVLVLLDAKREE